jgi:hypothetical protein
MRGIFFISTHITETFDIYCFLITAPVVNRLVPHLHFGTTARLLAAQCGDQQTHREENERNLGERVQRGRRTLWPDLFDRPDVCGRPGSASRHRPERSERRHIRLIGQPMTLSRTPSKMVARGVPRADRRSTHRVQV